MTKFGIQEINEFCKDHEDERVRIIGRRLAEARSKNAKWCDFASKHVPVPLVIEMKDDFDCPWVMTYEDKGSVSVDIYGPTRLALYFKTYDEMKAYLDMARTRRNGAGAKFDAYPLRRVT